VGRHGGSCDVNKGNGKKKDYIKKKKTIEGRSTPEKRKTGQSVERRKS